VKIDYAFLDKGCRGIDHHPPGVSCFISGGKRLLHYLKGEIGDQTNPINPGWRCP